MQDVVVMHPIILGDGPSLTFEAKLTANPRDITVPMQCRARRQ